MLDKIIKYGLYLLVFIFPLFFLPQTLSSIAAGKQILLSAFCFLIFILWLIKIISSGKLSFVWNKLTLAISLLLLVLGISTAFSSAKIQSFWGMNFEPDTFFSFILYGLVFFLFANLIKENERKSVLISFLAGSGVLALLFLFQVLNPIGTAQALAVFLGSAFLILVAITTNGQMSAITIRGKIISKKVFQALAVLLGLLLFVTIFLINYWPVWLGITFALGLILLAMLKKISGPVSQEQLKSFVLPMIIMVVALLLIFIKLPTGNILNIPAEISPTYQATFDISTNTLKEGPKNMILGSGPATFGYQYNLYQSGGLNLTNFWQLRFNQGTAVLPTLLTTSGILGILAVLFLLIVFFWQGFKTLISAKRTLSGTQLAAFTGSFYFLISWFLYPANPSLMFATFLMLGLWTASEGRTLGRTKEFLFTQSPQKAFMTMLLGVFLIVGSIFGLYTVSQNYAGAISYAKGLSLINAEEPKLDEGIIKINKAVNLDPKDTYFRNLSQAFLLKINQVLNNQELSQEQQQALFQQAVSNAELSATTAVQINPQNSQNWLQLGNIYENFVSLNIEGTGELAILNYQKAAELDPQNPQFPLSIGRIYKTELERLKVQLAALESIEDVEQAEIEQSKEAYNENFDLSMEYFNKSAELKPNFSAAYYLIAQNYETNDEKEKALENYQIVLQLEPENEEIQKKIEELSQ